MSASKLLSSFALVALLLGLVSVPLTSPSVVEARCARQALVPRVLTPSSTLLPRDGLGILVALRPQSGSGDSIAMPATVSLTRRRSDISLSAVQLAPGLTRFAPVESSIRPGPYTLSSPALGTPARYTVSRRAPAAATPTRPGVRALRRVAVASGRGPTRVEVRAHLEFPVPAGVVAVLVYWNDDATAGAWQPAAQGQAELAVFSEPGRCVEDPPGLVRPPVEGALRARIAYVDAVGQVSEPSQPASVD